MLSLWAIISLQVKTPLAHDGGGWAKRLLERLEEASRAQGGRLQVDPLSALTHGFRDTGI